MPTAPHAPGHSRQHPHPQPSTDWVVDVAVAVEALIALVIVAGIMALLIIV